MQAGNVGLLLDCVYLETNVAYMGQSRERVMRDFILVLRLFLVLNLCAVHVANYSTLF